ncbi:SpaA isopeptide-forming pilin-related protein [Faecalibaculum rodentium]|uniref:SpaA isopeptide-forming pilin-related protein n=2 Tax=Faecalibaculum rodentium TaxID=1702221 RepID=UPI0023F1B83B|nr:SpaA isopeptide-forming pilin-related protein [Faecalibaculum rodentium]
MKKNSLRFIAGLSAAAMFAMPMANAVAAPLTILAAGEGSITVKNLDESTSYEAYQILGPDMLFTSPAMQQAVSDTMKSLGWPIFDELINSELTDAEKAYMFSDMMAELTQDRKIIFANRLGENLRNSQIPHTAIPSSEKVNVPDGYYILVCNNKVDGDKEAATTKNILIRVSGDAEIYSKNESGTPTVDKDTNPSLAEWKTITIGEKQDQKTLVLPYTITASFPANIGDYKAYTMTFKDKIPAGIEITDDEYTSMDVKLVAVKGEDETEIEIADYSLGGRTDEGQQIITWKTLELIQALKNQGVIEKASDLEGVTLKLTYDLVINQDEVEATTTIDPTTNTITIEYPTDPFPGNNDPDHEGEGITDSTPETPENIYLYNLDLSKIDENNQALAGAEFQLFLVKNGMEQKVDTWVVKDGEDGSHFTFTGLVEGDYILKETVVPNGYKAIEPIEFTIKEVPGDGETVSAIEIINKNNDTHFTVTLGDKSETTDGKTKVTTTTAKIQATLVNDKGPNLPLTGESGMTLGLIVGGIVIAVSGYAVLKNKKEENA